jgi:murein DD-endopeptidase MepM/ murein hydrolase activator NlpD
MTRIVLKSVTTILILFTLTSCAMKSGRYVKRGNEWVFVSSQTGFNYFFNNSKHDDSEYIADPGRFIWPVPSSKRISSFYGSRRGRHHDGVDIPARSGSHILAAASGKVVHSGWMSGYGRVVIIKHGEGFHTVYAHNSKNMVSKNQKVSKGEVIAKVGSSGRSSGPHLHFEIRKNNKVRDPAIYIDRVRQRKLARR